MFYWILNSFIPHDNDNDDDDDNNNNNANDITRYDISSWVHLSVERERIKKLIFKCEMRCEYELNNGELKLTY